MTHDELLMLIIAFAVIIEIVATFRYLRRIPHAGILMGSFAALVLGCLFTVTEGFVWTGLFNVLEHLSMMFGAVLLALWCGLAFRPSKREGA